MCRICAYQALFTEYHGLLVAIMVEDNGTLVGAAKH